MHRGLWVRDVPSATGPLHIKQELWFDVVDFAVTESCSADHNDLPVHVLFLCQSAVFQRRRPIFRTESASVCVQTCM